MQADAQAVVEAFGKNEHVKTMFWTLFMTIAGLVLARVVDPGTYQQIVVIVTGIGGERTEFAEHPRNMQ